MEEEGLPQLNLLLFLSDQKWDSALAWRLSFQVGGGLGKIVPRTVLNPIAWRGFLPSGIVSHFWVFNLEPVSVWDFLCLRLPKENFRVLCCFRWRHIPEDCGKEALVWYTSIGPCCAAGRSSIIVSFFLAWKDIFLEFEEGENRVILIFILHLTNCPATLLKSIKTNQMRMWSAEKREQSVQFEYQVKVVCVGAKISSIEKWSRIIIQHILLLKIKVHTELNIKNHSKQESWRAEKK